MKTLKVLTLVVAVLFSVNMIAENEYAPFAVETAVANQNSESVYTLTKTDAEQPYIITVKHGKKGSDYLVQADGFEVLYQERDGKFGVAFVDEKEAAIGKEEMYKKLNRTEFLKQRVITNNSKTEAEYVALIGAYLPYLLN